MRFPSWAFPVVCVLVVLGGLEIACRLVIGHNEQKWLTLENGKATTFNQPDPQLGVKPRPNLHIEMIAERRGTRLYDVTATTDSLGRRISSTTRTTAPKFLLFFGDSFTFGIGVNDDETLPSRTEKGAPNYQAYNYGDTGYGPQEMLAKLEAGNLPHEIRQGEGTAIYTFIDDHIERALGSPRVFTHWGRNFPYYALDADGKLTHHGDFASGRPWLTRFYDLVGHSAFFSSALSLAYRYSINDRDLDLVTQMITSSQTAFRQQFPKGKFYVLFYPGANEFGPRMVARLQKAGVPTINYSEAELHGPAYWAADGWHPTAKTHAWVAGQLTRDLALYTDRN